MEGKNDFPNKDENQKEININNLEIKNINENAEKKFTNIFNNLKKDDKYSKLSKLIIKKNEYSNLVTLILTSKFNLWKNLTFINEERIERKTKKLLIKKTLNIRKGNAQNEIEVKEKPKTIKILKQNTPFRDIEEKKKRKRLIKLIETRITSFLSKKDIMRKFFNIWSSKILLNLSINESKVNKNITKKNIKLVKTGEKEDDINKTKDFINDEKNENNTKYNNNDNNKENIENNLLLEYEEEIPIEDKIYFLKNIFEYRDPLFKLFNYWKNISNIEQVETITKKKKILIKKTNIKNNEEIKEPKTITILKQTGVNKTNESIKRKQKLIKLIESRIISYKSKNDILRKYFYRWLLNITEEIKKDIIRISQIKSENDISEKNIFDINKFETQKSDIKIIEKLNSGMNKNAKEKEIQKMKENEIKDENQKEIKIVKKDGNIKFYDNKTEKENNAINKEVEKQVSEKIINKIELKDKYPDIKNEIEINNIKEGNDKNKIKNKNLEAVEIKDDEKIGLENLVIDNKKFEEEKKNIKENEIDDSNKVINEEQKNEDENPKKIDINDIAIKQKIKKIILIGNPMKIYFNKWRYLINYEEKEIIENDIKTLVLSKKKLIIKKEDIKPEDSKKNKIITIQKKSLKEKKEKINKIAEEKLINLIQNRINNYKSKKDILKKYYNIWISKLIINVENENIVNKIINKKEISLLKPKKEEDNILIKNKDNEKKNEEKYQEKENEQIPIEAKEIDSELIKNELNEKSKLKLGSPIQKITEIKNEEIISLNKPKESNKKIIKSFDIKEAEKPINKNKKDESKEIKNVEIKEEEHKDVVNKEMKENKRNKISIESNIKEEKEKKEKEKKQIDEKTEIKENHDILKINENDKKLIEVRPKSIEEEKEAISIEKNDEGKIDIKKVEEKKTIDIETKITKEGKNEEINNRNKEISNNAKIIAKINDERPENADNIDINYIAINEDKKEVNEKQNLNENAEVTKKEISENEKPKVNENIEEPLINKNTEQENKFKEQKISIEKTNDNEIIKNIEINEFENTLKKEPILNIHKSEQANIDLNEKENLDIENIENLETNKKDENNQVIKNIEIFENKKTTIKKFIFADESQEKKEFKKKVKEEDKSKSFNNEIKNNEIKMINEDKAEEKKNTINEASKSEKKIIKETKIDKEVPEKEGNIIIKNNVIIENDISKSDEEKRDINMIINKDDVIKYKLGKIIKLKNPIKIYFNNWKDILDFEEQEINEDGIKKIVLVKKKLIIRKDDIIQQDNIDNKIINISKKPFKERIRKRNKIGEDKLINLIKKKIINYNNNKDILKKYYNIWKIKPDIINETIVNKIIIKKVIPFNKIKVEEDSKINNIETKNDNSIDKDKIEDLELNIQSSNKSDHINKKNLKESKEQKAKIIIEKEKELIISEKQNIIEKNDYIIKPENTNENEIIDESQPQKIKSIEINNSIDKNKIEKQINIVGNINFKKPETKDIDLENEKENLNDVKEEKLKNPEKIVINFIVDLINDAKINNNNDN